MKREFKTVRGIEIKDADKGLVSAVFSTFGVKDSGDDVTLAGAFEEGSEVLISAYGHKSWVGAKPVGRGVIHSDQFKAWLDGQFFMDTIDGADTFKTLKGTAELQEWSYGFDVVETGEVTEDLRQRGVWRVIKKAIVYEVSPVLLGQGVDTETLSLKGRKAASDPCGTCTHAMDKHASDGVGACTMADCNCQKFAPAKTAAELLSTKARQEFARFIRTNARLAG